MADNSEAAGTGGAEINLNPEVSFEIKVPLYHYAKKYDIWFEVGTARDKFVVSDENGTEIMTITFKQVKSGNANYKSGLWYKIKGALCIFIEDEYPAVKITNDKLAFVESFARQFQKEARDIMARRTRIENELGALPRAFQTFIELDLPHANDGLEIIDSNALAWYNTKARRNKWQTIRNLEELAFIISQTFPQFQCRAARTQYTDTDGTTQRKVAIKCDIIAIARAIEAKLDELASDG